MAGEAVPPVEMIGSRRTTKGQNATRRICIFTASDLRQREVTHTTPAAISEFRLNRPAYAKLAHAGLERGSLHAQKHGRAFRAGNAPMRLFEGAQDVLALGFFESGNRGSRRG